jgi:hypothetical protein
MKDFPLVFFSFVARLQPATESRGGLRIRILHLDESSAVAAELVMSTTLRTITAWQDW